MTPEKEKQTEQPKPAAPFEESAFGKWAAQYRKTIVDVIASQYAVNKESLGSWLA